jgi:hypothetical protein
MDEKRKPGRPKSGAKLRESQVSFFLTEDDAQYFADRAKDLGFSSRSQMFTAIAERLVLGGMSGLVFAKIGWQFAKLAESTGAAKQAGFYFGVRPLPPLIGDEQNPDPGKLVPFLEGLKQEAKQEAKEVKQIC